MPITRAVRGLDSATAGRLEEHDIVALVQLCDAQTAALDRVRSALDAHRETVADQLTIRQMLAHELRTPLAVVVGALGTLQSSEVDDDARRSLVDMAHRQAVQLTEIVEDIVHLSGPTRVEAPRMALEKVSVEHIVYEACDAARPDLDAAIVDVQVPRNLVAATVPTWFRQIVANLLGHAARSGVTAVRVSAARADGVLVVEVAGTAPSRAGAQPPSMPSRTQGAGVGLYVVRALTRALGGRVDVDTGTALTTARVVLPQRRASDA